jgi:signal transduction histidine kinase
MEPRQRVDRKRLAWRVRARLKQVILGTERSLRNHPGITGLLTVAAVAVITAIKQRVGTEESMALTYAIPVALCAYGIGFGAGVIVAAVTAVLWTLNANGIDLPLGQFAAVAALRMATEAGIAAIAAMGASAARRREAHIAAQEELGQLRTDFLAAFAHDLRTPLSAIIGFAQIAREELNAPPRGELAESLDRIMVNARYLADLIADMMGIQQSDTGAALSVSAFSPRDLVDELRVQLEPMRATKVVELKWQIEPATAAFGTDRQKLISIVRNLVNNALKFTRHGTVTVRIGYRNDSATHVIEVKDTGVGIRPEVLPHIFDRFYRGSWSANVGGFGFGLFIVKRFTDLLGGKIDVTSTLGRGTRFVVTIPRLEAPNGKELGSSKGAETRMQRAGEVKDRRDYSGP